MATIRIERLANGFTVEMDDPKIIEANRKRDLNSKNYVPYRDPTRKFSFDSEAKVIAFLKANLKKAMPTASDEFDHSFTMATNEKDD